MSVKVRLSRTGKRNAPSYRIVAIDSRSPRDGRPLEILGHYNPSMTPESFAVKKDRIKYWQSVGAQMTAAVEKLLKGEYKYEKYEPKKEAPNSKHQ
jgi:small subunit ribosomal protein S16